MQPAPALVPLRGPSGRLWGMFDPRTQTLEFRHGRHIERIDLTVYTQTLRPKDKASGS
jgi:hypothetical protein